RSIDRPRRRMAPGCLALRRASSEPRGPRPSSKTASPSTLLSRLQLQKPFDTIPDEIQAPEQLVIVVDQRKRDVRPPVCKSFNVPKIDQRVAKTLKDERRRQGFRLQGIVAHQVFVKREAQKALFTVAVVKKWHRALPAPLFDLPGRQKMVAGPGKHHSGRQKY